MSEADQKIVDRLQDPSQVQITLQVSTQDDNGCQMSYSLGDGVKGPVLVYLAANLLVLAQKAMEFLREDAENAGVAKGVFEEQVAAAMRGEWEPEPKTETPPESEPREPL